MQSSEVKEIYVKRKTDDFVEIKRVKKPKIDSVNDSNEFENTQLNPDLNTDKESNLPTTLNQNENSQPHDTDTHYDNPSINSIMLDTIQIPSTPTDNTEITTLKLPHFLITSLKKHSISSLFPIQSSLLPSLLKTPPPPLFYDVTSIIPSDICVSAPTGSGKTLCYLLPILSRLHQRVVPRLRALVVLPTKDLANQVHLVFNEYTRKTDLKVQLLNKDCRIISDKLIPPDVIVCTPGKLVDSLKSESGLKLQDLEFLVVDEADRLLDQSYHEWIPLLISHLPSYSVANTTNDVTRVHCRKFLFSATLTRNPERLSQLQLYRPILYTIETTSLHKYTLPPLLTQFVYTCTSTQDKLLLLYHVLKHDSVTATLCFTNSKENTNRLYLFLVNLGFNVNEFSSQLNDKQRRSVFNKFAKNEIDILICTDAMARGIDIQNVKHVINYDCPPFLRNYIHRVGRTARANQSGNAFTLLEQCEVYHFKKMMKDASSSFQIKRFSTFQLLPYKVICSSSLSRLRDQLDTT